MSSTASGASPTLPAPKQLRFVNNEGQPPAKRRRINAACRTCRKRKTRCDGKRPLCSTCTENGHECLGYAEGGDIKKETKGGSNTNRIGDDDNDDDDEDIKNAGSQAGHGYKGFGNGSPELRRPELQGYFDNALKAQDEEEDNEREGNLSFPAKYRDTAAFSDGEPSLMGRVFRHADKTAELIVNNADRSTSLQSESHRVPYFRYFGPTAIVPGFKQMVVSVREHRRSTGAGSSISMSPGSGGYGGGGSVYGGTPSQAGGSEPRANAEMPIYDQSDPLPVNRLIIHLVETFFAHLGCNFPFLRQRSFIQRVEERSVEAILVDAVCSLAARFSDHPLLTASHDSSYPKSEYGHVFAQRAKSAVVDTFPRPTVAATQACLLLAYEGFGSNQDSALWMYLGCAIRMAVDLGLQKIDGVKYQGQKDPGHHRSSNDSGPSDQSPELSAKEMKEIEQERINTLWTVFMLDRVISTGTGRPVTLRDEDFELSFPAITASTKSGWPDPFPALIQIIHLYGRVSDLLNNIRNVNDLTPRKIEGLVSMEKDLTQLYQKLDPRLNFNATNFQHYCKAGEGTNFILVHFWFHTLIMLLHQPSLMHSFEGQILSLLPHSRELSMSSAKTVADILAFAELIDPRSFIGNPFTSQPMYIAACAFLMESAAHTSNTSSRDTTPPDGAPKTVSNKEKKVSRGQSTETKQKHSLLASAANQNYQRCYKALQQLEIHWAGVRYILVALDQKAKGIWDPETYTEQEYEATKTKHDLIPTWRRRLSLAGSSTPGARFAGLVRSPRMEPGSPTSIDPSQAIGWSLNGTTNSPSSNLTFMYQNMNGEQLQTPPPPLGAGNMIYDPIRSSLPESTAASTSTSTYPSRYQVFPRQPTRHNSQSMAPPVSKYTTVYSDPASTSDAEMLLGLQNSPFAQTSGPHHSFEHAPNITSPPASRQIPSNGFDFPQTNTSFFQSGSNGYMGLGGGVGEMMMQSQEIDMSALGGDMMPWLEYLPQNMLEFFDNGNAADSINGGDHLGGG